MPYPSDFERLDALEGPWVEAIQSALRSPFMDGLMKGLTSAGKWPMSLLMIAGGILLFWGLARREGMRRLKKRAFWAALLLAYSIGMANAVGSLMLKPAFDRPAPSRTHRAVEPIAHGSKHNSFPSNHAATSFAAVTVLGFVYGFRRVGLFYLVAALVGFSRVYCGSHYPSDVAAGGALGALIGLGFGLAWRSRYNAAANGEAGGGRVPDPDVGPGEGRGAGD